MTWRPRLQVKFLLPLLPELEATDIYFNGELFNSTIHKSHNEPVPYPIQNKKCTLMFWMVRIWDRCIVGFVRLVNWHRGDHEVFIICVKAPSSASSRIAEASRS